MNHRDHNTSDAEEAEYEEYTPVDDKAKKMVVYGEYDQKYYSPLRKKRIRIRISIMDMMIGFFVVCIIAFIVYRSIESYGAQARDDIRTGHLAVIREGLDRLQKEGKPLPEAYLKKEILVNSTVSGVQGFAGEALFSAIGKKVLKDPLDNTYYTYYYSTQSKQYEVMAYLEGTGRDTVQQDISIWRKIQHGLIRSTDYQNRTPYSIGSLGNILLANVGSYKNSPINTVIPADKIDLSNLTKFEDILYLGANCQDIMTKFPDTKGKDGNHLILIGGVITKVYCDMTTDGGGWTLFYANNGHKESPIALSYVQMRDQMKKGVYVLADYANPNLAGLYDTTHFTTNGAKQVLATNRVGGGGKWVKFTFDTSESLSWALGKDILGKTSSGCYTIPNNGSWSIVSNDSKIQYDGLKKIMNAGGNSWGVSHVEYPCNNQDKSLSSHIGFYRASGNMFEHRTRSTEGIGGNLTVNEYRYFIR